MNGCTVRALRHVKGRHGVARQASMSEKSFHLEYIQTLPKLLVSISALTLNGCSLSNDIPSFLLSRSACITKALIISIPQLPDREILIFILSDQKHGDRKRAQAPNRAGSTRERDAQRASEPHLLNQSSP